MHCRDKYIVVHGGNILGPFANVEEAENFAEGCTKGNGHKAFIMAGITVCEPETPPPSLPEIPAGAKGAMVNEIVGAAIAQFKDLLPQLLKEAVRDASKETPPAPPANAPTQP